MDSAGAKSVMSNDMKELSQGKEDISNIIRGHKANLSNPNTSEASKDNSKKELEALGGSDTLQGHRDNPVSKNAADKLYGSRASSG
ncbi:Conidiation-specific protein 6 [Madurella mycetomatis]|uniref:Conidiation-specific protein 6 n=1 Tax=Madurella mycetomatis TaxID=100816 RepID=A0A175VSC1_9PEZI|nr:Conidiation-specific protein 6 [Madurella mycetomatis]